MVREERTIARVTRTELHKTCAEIGGRAGWTTVSAALRKSKSGKTQAAVELKAYDSIKGRTTRTVQVLKSQVLHIT